MTPLESSFVLTTLVGLICNWSQERSAQSTDDFQDFITWLSNHHFNELHDQILSSKDLQIQLSALLRQDSADLNRRLDTLVTAISAVADKIDSFTEIGRALHTTAASLSSQAIEILKSFEQSSASRMVVFDQPPICAFIHSDHSYKASEARFLESDVIALSSMGFIELVDHNSSGNRIYSLTRAGSALATNSQLGK
jgi:hypothetical protein